MMVIILTVFCFSLSLSVCCCPCGAQPTREFFDAAQKSGGMEFHYIDSTLFGLAVLMKQTIISNSPSTDPRRGGVSCIPPGHPPLHSFLGIPLMANGVVMGLLGVANRPGGYTMELVHQLEPFVITCAGIVKAMRLQRKQEEEERKRRRFWACLSHELRTPLVGR